MIKERLSNDYCRIREDNYDHSFEKVARLVAEAKRDFPDLEDKNVRIVVYGGDTISRTMGIEFYAPNHDLPIDRYRRVAGKFEPTLT